MSVPKVMGQRKKVYSLTYNSIQTEFKSQNLKFGKVNIFFYLNGRDDTDNMHGYFLKLYKNLHV